MDASTRRHWGIVRALLAGGASVMLSVGQAGAQAPADPFNPRPGGLPASTPPTGPRSPSDPFRVPGSVDPGTPGSGTPGAPDGVAQPGQVALEDLVPQLRAGFRGEFLRQQQAVIPVVVVVPDAGSYLRALGAWKPLERFPVLIDDGSREAREDIARFVRAFEPERVVRWSAPDAPDVDSAEAVQREIDATLAGVWGLGGDGPATIGAAVLAACHAEAPGVVVTHGGDPAWTAGAALAIGRGQPIVWIQTARGVNGALTRAQGESLCASLQTGLTAKGLAWDAIGDTIETVALCLNTPVKIELEPGQTLATTDRLVRFSDARNDTRIWGWASQVHGSERRAAYRAMCGLFLPITDAWLFDGYPPNNEQGQPWDSYKLAFAAEAFSQITDFTGTLEQRPNNSIAHWRVATSGPITASLLMVNTHGTRGFFELPGGTAWCGDVPVLGRPSVLYFIHSWSAVRPEDRDTVAGRWFERGAYAYCGSVQEPYLAAFVPPGAIAQRLASMAPWAVACRGDNSPAWRIAMFGDPLITLGPAQARSEEALPLEGAVEVEQEARDALRERRYLDAIVALTLMGRDEAAARLGASLVASSPEAATPDVLHAALFPMYRAARDADLQAAYSMLDDTRAADPQNRDLLWFSARRTPPETGRALALLRPNIRPEMETSDTIEVANHAAMGGRKDSAILMLTQYRATLTDQARIRQVDTAIQAIRGR
ncbi:MAG: hypothetical protein KDA05_07700 [Phycisphaerales bacterium]|nr:hypothetical protein [Phycisphaerales bacterium]